MKRNMLMFLENINTFFKNINMFRLVRRSVF